MPLNNITNFCSAKSRRTGLPCNNPKAWGCKTCKQHGAFDPNKRITPKGKSHWNYKNGAATKEAKAEYIANLTWLRYLRDLGDHIGIFTGSRTRGRKPTGYVKLNLDDPTQMALVILKTSKGDKP